ncbi:MAG: SusC/RagA family TonB-linked outer membrane protein, partial [Marinifilaceae bacterium]|nr:SusC/RagA family TonB-linked outer membrane protein [Marinifilaceae bacterium]
LKGTGFKRVDLNMTMNVTPVKKFNIDMRFNASIANRKRGTNSGSQLGAAPSIETVPGDPFELSTLKPGAGSAPWEAALDAVRGTKEANRNIRLRANFRVNYEVIKDLNISASLSADYSIARRNYFQPSYMDSEGRSQSVGETGINMMILTEEVLSWRKTLGEDHNFNLMAGFSYQYDQMEYNGGYAMNSPSDKIYYAPSMLPSLDQEEQGGTTNVVAMKYYESDMQEKGLMSYFARLEYNFREKYLVSVSFRRDGSSTFGENHRWGTFPSVAAGWSFSEEPFIKNNVGWLSFGKIRASWGRSGMHFDYPYLALGILSVGDPFQGEATLTPDFVSGLYNEDLSWENTDQYDIGLDLDFFNYRLGVVLDYYYRYTDDLLMQVPLSQPNTYQMQWRNAAAISNEGVELLVKYDIFQKDDLYWKISVNGAKNWNKFRKSYSGYDESGWIIGKPLNGVYAIPTEGWYNYQEEVPIVYNNSAGYKSYMGSIAGYVSDFFMPGDLKYVDVNGDGAAGYDDEIYIGSALPEVSGGLVSEFRWKNIDVSLSMAYQIGRHIVNSLPFGSLTGLKDPFIMDIQGTTFWEKPGDDPDYPSWRTDRTGSHFNSGAACYVEKVNWLKLKTLSIGYSLPKAWMKKLGMKELRVFASGENLLKWDNYSGLDPETVDITSGYDGGRNYPLARKLTLGLTLKF